jgi:hypothetical protein
MLLIYLRYKIKTQIITLKDHFLTNKTVCRKKEKFRRRPTKKKSKKNQKTRNKCAIENSFK